MGPRGNRAHDCDLPPPQDAKRVPAQNEDRFVFSGYSTGTNAVNVDTGGTVTNYGTLDIDMAPSRRTKPDNILCDDTGACCLGEPSTADPNGAKISPVFDVGWPSRLPFCLKKAGGTPAPLWLNLVPFTADPFHHPSFAEQAHVLKSILES